MYLCSTCSTLTKIVLVDDSGFEPEVPQGELFYRQRGYQLPVNHPQNNLSVCIKIVLVDDPGLEPGVPEGVVLQTTRLPITG